MAECTENDLEICRFRGDTKAVQRVITQDGSPSVVDISLFSFLLTVNTVKNPDISVSPEVGVQLFQIIGTIVNGPAGQFEFQYTASPNPAELDAGSYYYDMQMTDGGGIIRTIAKAKYVVKQDITK